MTYETLENAILREWGKRGLAVLKEVVDSLPDGSTRWTIIAKPLGSRSRHEN